MIAQTVDAGDNFKKQASIPLAPCIKHASGLAKTNKKLIEKIPEEKPYVKIS
jgi:hypothetical protein